MLKGKTVLLAVTGSIAAYKTAYLASALRKLHAQVHVLMTANATNFINPLPLNPLPEINVLWILLTGTFSSRWNMFPLRRRRTS